MNKAKLLSVAVSIVMLAVIGWIQKVSAQMPPDGTCMNNAWNAAPGPDGKLNCTAKEVYISEDVAGNKIINAEVVEFDGKPDGCDYPGDTATVRIIADIHFNASRYDVGIYSSSDGGDALFGACYVDPLPLAPHPAVDYDGPPDTCGDVDVTYGNDLKNFKFQEMELTCLDTDQDGFLDFDSCFSWRTSGNNDLCDEASDLYPGTKSKCFCERVNIPVEVPEVKLTVVKTASPLTVPEPGGSVVFSVSVTNPGIDPKNNVTLDILTDNIYGDITSVHGDISATTCGNAIGYVLTGNGGTYSCNFTAWVGGNAYEYQIDKVTVAGTDDYDRPVDGEDEAKVDIVDVPPAITVTKTAYPTSVIEPGDVVEFTVKVFNDSSVEVLTLTSLTDAPHGDLNGQGNCSVPQSIAIGGSYTCTFTAMVAGAAFDAETDIVTAKGEDDDGNIIEITASATVNIADNEAKIELIKTATPTAVNEPGANVTYTFTINNLSNVDTVTINSLHDDIYGDLNGQGCSVPQILAPSESYSCSITKFVSGDAGNSKLNIATAIGLDDDNQPLEAQDDATVNILNVPPAAHLTKTVTQMVVTYQVKVFNDSGVEAIYLDSLTDNQFGDLNGKGTCTATGQEIPVSSSYTCTFDELVTNSPHTDTVTGTVRDNEYFYVDPDPSDSATVTFGN